MGVDFKLDIAVLAVFMNKNKLNCAEKVSQLHHESEESITSIYLISSDDEDGQNEPIKLLEVNRETVSSGIVPVTIMPSGDIPFSTTIIEITPNEYTDVTNGKLSLPDGWKVLKTLYGEELNNE